MYTPYFFPHFDKRSTCQDHIKQMEEVKTKQDLLIDSMNEDIKRLTERKAKRDSWKWWVSFLSFCTWELQQQLPLHHVIHKFNMDPKMVLLFPQSCNKMGLSWPSNRIVAAGVGQGSFVLKVVTAWGYPMLNFRCVPFHKRLDVKGQNRCKKR